MTDQTAIKGTRGVALTLHYWGGPMDWVFIIDRMNATLTVQGHGHGQTAFSYTFHTNELSRGTFAEVMDGTAEKVDILEHLAQRMNVEDLAEILSPGRALSPGLGKVLSLFLEDIKIMAAENVRLMAAET